MGVTNEQEIETRQSWYGRLAQARQKLSLSVKETLEETVAEDDFWQDEIDERLAIESTPAVSQQSSQLGEPQASTSPSEVSEQHFSEKKREDGEDNKDSQEQHSTTARPASKLLSFAQRLTTSLVSLRGSKSTSKAEAPQNALLLDAPAPPSADVQVATDTGATSSSDSTRDDKIQKAVEKTQTAEKTQEETRPASTRAEVWAPIPPSVACSQMGQGRQRLGGYTTKIRLEVVPLAPIAPTTPPVKAGTQDVELEVVEKREAVVPDNNPAPITPALAEIEKMAGVKPVELASETMTVPSQPGEGVREGAIFGSGIFECGRRYATIANPHITASSVVLVMLTASPGPIVVQYVSLKPGEGFTVHLTAPATANAPFNYAVLQAAGNVPFAI